MQICRMRNAPAYLLGKRKINNFEGVLRSVWWLRSVSYEVLTT